MHMRSTCSCYHRLDLGTTALRSFETMLQCLLESENIATHKNIRNAKFRLRLINLDAHDNMFLDSHTSLDRLTIGVLTTFSEAVFISSYQPAALFWTCVSSVSKYNATQ